MHIAIDGRSIENKVGGVKFYTTSLVKGLHEHGHDVILFSHTPLEIKDIKNIVVPRTFGPFKIKGLAERYIFPLLAIHKGCDILHYPADIGRPGLKSCPPVLTVHDIYCFSIPHIFPEKERINLQKNIRLSVNKCIRIITPSLQTKKDIESHLNLSHNKIEVVPLAPDSIFKPLENFSSFNKTLPEMFILCVGGKNNRPHKNIHVVVEAMAHKIFRKKLSDLHLIIVGHESEYLKYVKNLANKLGVEKQIHFTRVVDKHTLLYLYNKSMALVFPSLYEGFGLPILEAMACGTPVITSNFGAMKEVAGDAAILINPENPEEIGAAIVNILTNPSYRESLKEGSLARASNFTWSKVIDKTVKFYESVSAGN